jgi:peptide/nickel transport system permease protein
MLYVGKRLFFMIPLLLGITIICFGVMHLAPGSPTDMQTQMNPRASVEAQARLRAMYDLDKPLYEQYWIWLKKVVVFDLGTSFSSDRRPVTEKIRERIPITVLLNVLSLILILMVAIPSELPVRPSDECVRLCGLCRADFLAGAAVDDFFRHPSGLVAHFGSALPEL